ncbi:sulfotransferase domain-containing protein [Paraliomyxa miuraensis]|uniref:sulfotransferase domain-containing protein n=1 Tax=Paraliomyxa miuraensis TaxID=376150 RepID=UPI00225C39DD|nr:sulfotransferase domain-containing protein [Paraliomyxa miuraensis]MCX4245675.1 sulfotransferase domain-containing protein [Paraliomyxa miuraensis]
MSSIDRLEAGLGDLRRTAAFVQGRLQFEPRADDVYVATYPRSGTTWMLFMLHLLVRGPEAEFRHLQDVCPWFERSLAIGSLRAEDLRRLPSPRIFKTHLPPRWLPTVGRFVVIVRDPSDVALSYYGLHRDYLGFGGSLDEFLVRFCRGRVQYGSWWTHVEQWQRRAQERPGAVVLRYEALRADPLEGLREVAEAVGWSVDEARLAAAVEGASLSRMKALEERFDHATSLLLERGVSPRSFIGKGAAGARSLSPEQRARIHAAGRQASRRHAPWELPAFLH